MPQFGTFFIFFLISSQPSIECRLGLSALNTSTPRNRCNSVPPVPVSFLAIREEPASEPGAAVPQFVAPFLHFTRRFALVCSLED